MDLQGFFVPSIESLSRSLALLFGSPMGYYYHETSERGHLAWCAQNLMARKGVVHGHERTSVGDLCLFFSAVLGNPSMAVLRNRFLADSGRDHLCRERRSSWSVLQAHPILPVGRLPASRYWRGSSCRLYIDELAKLHQSYLMNAGWLEFPNAGELTEVNKVNGENSVYSENSCSITSTTIKAWVC